MIINHGRAASLVLSAIGTFSLAACESSGSYRVASVGTTVPGDVADNGSGGGDTGTGSGSGMGGGTGAGGGAGGSTGAGGATGSGALGGNLIATSGNAVLGVANAQAGLTSSLGIPAKGVVTGTVNRLLTATGQTLVRLGNGNTLVLDGKGKLGELVSIDLGKGRVIGTSNANSPLLGVNVLARNPATGKLATVSAASGGNLVSVTVPNGQGGQLLGATVPGNPAGGTGGLLGGVTGAANTNANVNGTANSALGTVNATVNGVVNPQGVKAGANANVVTNTTNAVGGLVTGLTGSKPR
jgi:hypothetical protein